MQAYVISRTDLKTKDVAAFISYEINADTASAVQSSFSFASAPNASNGDYILLRGIYLGIISGMEADKKTTVTTLRSFPVGSILSRNILLDDPQNITESYIVSVIIDNFVNSGDALIDIPYIAALAKTQTSLGITPHNENGIYNVETFLRYCAMRHHIFADFELTPEALTVGIENRTPPMHIIDATVADILNLNETVVSDCVSKLTVKTSTGVATYYLFDDGTFGTNPLSGIRVQGKADTLYCENAADAEKAAGDLFAKNKYSHLIEVEILSSSKLYNTANMRLYDRVKIKTKTGVYDSYISFKSQRSAAKTVLFKFGDAKLTLTDKLKGGI